MTNEVKEEKKLKEGRMLMSLTVPFIESAASRSADDENERKA